MDTVTLFLLVTTALIAGLARGFSGFGAALIFVPLAAMLIGPHRSAPVLLLADSVVALPLVLSAWPRAEKREVVWMTVGAFVGAPVGTWIMSTLDGDNLRWVISGITAVMLALLLSGWRYRGVPKPPITVGVGAVSGLFSGIAQIGGPPAVAYWLGRDTPTAVMRASTITFFAMGSAASIASYLVAGLLTRDVVWLSLTVLPFFGAGLWLGTRMFGLAQEQVFRRICLTLISLSLVLSLPALSR